MDTDPSTGPYLSNGISKGAQSTATKFSTTLSKQNKQSLQSIHENHDSNHMTRDEEVWLHEDKDEKEQRAIDYLKELSDNEPPSTSNFEAGLRNFCLANFPDNKNKKQPKVETQKSARSALISMLPKHKELTEHSLVAGNTSKSPSMQQHLELLDSNKEKKPIKVETSPLVKPFKIKGIRPKETSQGPTEEMQKQKAMEIAEMVDLGREKNRKEALMMESQFGAFKRIPLQIGTATFLKEKPRHSSQEEDSTGRVPNNLRTAQSFSKQIKSKLLHEQILNGRSLSVPKMDKLKDTSLMRNSMGFEEIGIPIVINGGLGLVSLNRKENRDEITIKRDVDKETGAVTGLRRSSTNLNNTKEESSKENLQNIVKAALYTKVQPVVNPSEHFPGSQTERGISNVTVAQFWNYNNKGLSTERTKPKTTTKSGGIKENRARTESPERDPVKEARDKKRKELKSRELKPFRDIHARTTSTFQSMRWIQAESHNVISGIQGKSFMVTQLFKDQQYTKGSLFTDDVEEPSSSRLGLKDTNCEPDFIQSSSHSPRPSISRSNSQPHLNVPNQKPASHSLLHRFKGFSKGLTSKVKNVGSLTARLTSHEDLLNGVSISKEYNESKMASLIQEDLKPAARVQTSSKDKRYLKLRNKSRGNTSSMSRKDHTLLTTASIDIRAKPLNMSLYNWAASFGAHLKKNSVS